MKRIVFSGILGLISFTSQAQDQTVNGHLTVENQLTVNSISKFLNTSYWGGDASTSFGLTTWGSGFGGLGIGTNAGKGDLIFFTDFAAQQPQKRMVIQQTTGNVGIGTNSPIANLQVGSGTSNGLINLGGYSNIGNLRSSGDLFVGNRVYAKYSSASENNVIRATQDATTGFSTAHFTEFGDIKFYANNSFVSFDTQVNTSDYNVFSILGNGNVYAKGNVGIGTTAPLEKLHVDGTVLSNGLKFGMAGRKLEFYESAGSRAHILLYNSANGNIEIENNFSGGDAHILLNPDKNVGIGVSAPLEKLHIDGTVLSNGLKFGMAGRKLEFYESAGSRAHLLLYNSANGNIELENNWVGGDAHIILNPDKYVGIGTSNPVSTLEIFNPNGSATELTISGNSNGAIDAGLVLKANNAGANFNGTGIFMHDKTAANEWFVGRPYATSDMFTICRKTGTTDHMRETSMLDNSQALFSVLNDGKVGIGTIAPTSKLEIKASDNNSSLFSIKDNVGGDILKVRGQDRTMYVRSLEVTLLNFPDYVFEKNYPLMPLKDVESYIQANKHLPNIPSAKEIEENGANLGELVKLQMEKIEELTLYMIELQKANEATNKENAEIKKQLEELKMK